jgi:hypothetical protein
MQQSDVSFTLTLSDGDRLAIVSITPMDPRERIICLRVIQSIVSELGLSRRIWSFKKIAEMVDRLAKQCRRSAITWDHVAGGAPLALPGRPSTNGVLKEIVLDGAATRPAQQRPAKGQGRFKDVILGETRDG